MNREILFRGKRVDNGEWVEGLPSYDMSGNLEEIEVYRGLCNCSIHEVDHETICQYTGLTDKNGRKIFEGDILSFTQKGQTEKGIAKMVDGCFFAIIEGQKCWLSEGVKRYKGEIIDNVFDNPNLLKE